MAKTFYLKENRKTSNVADYRSVFQVTANDLRTAKSYLKSGFFDRRIDETKEKVPDKVIVVGKYLNK